MFEFIAGVCKILMKFSHQVVQSLSAGEYVVSVLAKRISSSSEAAKLDLVSAKTALTPSSVDTNLQLVFNCLDIEGKHELSESDVCNFLQLYEHIAPSPRRHSRHLSWPRNPISSWRQYR